MNIDKYYKMCDHCWVIIIQGDNGKHYNETSLEELQNLFRNKKPIEGYVAGQPKRKTDVKMYNDTEVPRYIGFNYKTKLYIFELDELEPLHESDKIKNNNGSIIYKFTVKRLMGSFKNRKDMKLTLDKTNTSNTGVIKLNKPGSFDYESKRQKLINQYEKLINYYKM
jgi:hypothetical protein